MNRVGLADQGDNNVLDLDQEPVEAESKACDPPSRVAPLGARPLARPIAGQRDKPDHSIA